MDLELCSMLGYLFASLLHTYSSYVVTSSSLVMLVCDRGIIVVCVLCLVLVFARGRAKVKFGGVMRSIFT